MSYSKRWVRVSIFVLILVGLLTFVCGGLSEGTGSNASPAYSTVEEAVDGIVQEMKDAGITGEYNQAVWLHNWLTHHANYDYTLTYYSAEGVLLLHTGVCQSYVNAYQLLLNKVGIANQVISSDEMNHAWSLVKLEGKWCHVDCTWDDPGEGGSENLVYFGMSDDLISRDHQWNKSDYPACTTTANYYYLRNGYAPFTTVEEMETALESAAAEQQSPMRFVYMGLDGEFNTLAAFEKWFNTVNWKYGMRDFEGVYHTFYGNYDITYSDPWNEPVTKLAEPVDAPSFTLKSPRGVYRLSDYSNNGIVLVFGRNGCSNTAGLLSRLLSEQEKLNANGVEVLVSVEAAETVEDIMAMEEQYSGFKYVYEQGALLGQYLDAVGYEDNWVTYPCVFIINSDGKITYYSTGYVTNLNELISEAFVTATGKALPEPGEVDYSSYLNGDGNVEEADGGTIISAIREAMKDGSHVICLTDASFYSSFLNKWEGSYSLYSALGMKLVASFANATDAQKENYPHVIFADFDNNDFWQLLEMVNYADGSAYYRGSYLFKPDGSCIAYSNGSVLPLNDCTVLVCESAKYDFSIPDSLTAIDEEAFSGSTFTNADLTTGKLTEIGSLAFARNSQLRLVRIPGTVTYIADDAFLGSDHVIILCAGDSYACKYAIRKGINYINK